MKTRNGFVSNSSSSNFIIRNNINTLQVARSMISHIDTTINKKLKRFDRLIKNNKDSINIDIPIVFNTCNYDTYIYRFDNDIFIDTCNNEDWYEVLKDYSYSTRPDEDIEQPNIYFWFLDIDILMKPVPYDLAIQTFCKKHYYVPAYIYNEQTIVCPRCYLDKPNSHTFTQLNRSLRAPPKLYYGPNIRRYQYTRSFK